MHKRREILSASATLAAMLVTSGLMPARAQSNWSKEAFDAKTLAEATKGLGGAAPVASKDVTVTGPDIAENGAVVPVGASTSLPGVKRLPLMVEKNPNALAAVFDLSDAVDANVSTRVKMGQSSNVFSVAHNGKTVMTAQWGPAVSKNPFMQCTVKGAKAGDKITVTWVDNQGDKRADEATVS